MRIQVNSCKFDSTYFQNRGGSKMSMALRRLVLYFCLLLFAVESATAQSSPQSDFPFPKKTRKHKSLDPAVERHLLHYRVQGLTATIAVKKRVYFEAIHDRMRTFAPSAMPMFVLETAGGINVAADAVPHRGTNIADYGKERILSRAKQIDVYLAQSGAMNRPTISTIKNEPGFHAIKAVSNNQIFIIDEQIVSRPTLRLLKGIHEIGKILYPDIFNTNLANF